MDRTRLVSERLTDGEAAEAVRRLDKGGTGYHPFRRHISATVERPQDGLHGCAVLVKDPDHVEAARDLLEDEGWPVYRPDPLEALGDYLEAQAAEWKRERLEAWKGAPRDYAMHHAARNAERAFRHALDLLQEVGR